MSSLLQVLFSWVCGQNPDHTWMPGGVLLPCCQRCLGMYGGAVMALALLILLRPHPTARFLQFNGLLLLQMVPFGFHWVPHGPWVRTVTGYLFGFGLVTFLWLVPCTALWQASDVGRDRPRAYWFWAAIGLAILAALANFGGSLAAVTLTAWAALGLPVLAGLAGVNIVLGAAGLGRWLTRTQVEGGT